MTLTLGPVIGQIGGGGGVEEIPVSMSGAQTGVYPLATVDAGAGAWVWAEGEKTSTTIMRLMVGGKEYPTPSGAARSGGGGHFTSTVEVSISNASFGSATFTGTVYVTRM